MTINFSSAKSGWSQYVTNGTKIKPRDKEKIEIIEGDFELGDKLCENNKYEESYYRIVLAFKGKPSKEVMLKAYEEFKKKWFVGLDQDEYHINSIFHFDTDNYHIHIRVPKQNLLTNTHLQLYMHSIDMPRKQLLQDYISLKYNLPIAREEEKPLTQKSKKVEYIKSWREQHNIKPFNFSKRKEKQAQEAKILEYLKSGYEVKSITSLDEVKEELKKLKLKVVNEGYDKTKQFHYITVADSNNKKLRLKGELFSEELYSKTNTKVEIKDTEEVRLQQVKRELRQANEARYKKCQELFSKQRIKAETELKNIFKKEKRNDTNRTNVTRSTSPKQRATEPTKPRERRTRSREDRAREREKRIEEYSQHNNQPTNTNFGSYIRRRQQQQLIQQQQQREQRSRGIISRLFNKISDVTRQFFDKIKVIEITKTTPTTTETKKTPLEPTIEQTTTEEEEQEADMTTPEVDPKKFQKMLKDLEKRTETKSEKVR